MDGVRRAAWLAILTLAAATTAPQAALPDLEGAVALAARFGITCAARAGGGVSCWGAEAFTAPGQYVMQRSTSGRAAGPVSGAPGNVTRIAVGEAHACAVAGDASVWCWGRNDSGQLGFGSVSYGNAPPATLVALAGVTDVAAGSRHTCAVAVGVAYCWGDNGAGELGDGSTLQRDAPVPVAGLPAGATRVTAGAEGSYTGGFSCALAGGGAWCWGANNAGQLGDGTVVQRVAPVPVIGLASATTDIAAAAAHACAVQAGGVRCWGSNGYGQLGDGTFVDRPAPVAAVNAGSNIVAVATGRQHTCALRDDGAVLCWGANGEGQLGDGTQDQRIVAAPVIGLAAPAVAIAAGSTSTCALLATGRVQCFGTPLGIAFLPTREKPAAVESPNGVQRLSAGATHTCGVDPAGAAFCFGQGAGGALGNGARRNAPWPVPVSGLGSGVADVVAGEGHSCGRTAAGAALCWGEGAYGQLGHGQANGSLLPVAVSGLGAGVTDIALAGQFSCAVAGGAATCWGRNDVGQLGNGTTSGSTVPVVARGLGQGVLRIYAGGSHACALRSDGGLKCWGGNASGELGDGTFASRATPVDVALLPRGLRGVALGSQHSCAIDGGGGLWCWGNNWTGQLGDGTELTRPVAVPVAGLAAGTVAVAAGGAHTCALLPAGEVRCWGRNMEGQLGAAAAGQFRSLLPVPVPLDEPALMITAGGTHSCAVLASGRAQCWGTASEGQLGNGDAWRSPLPRTVKVGAFDAIMTLATTPNPSASGQYVSISVRVDAPETIPTGMVRFSDGPSPLACGGLGAAGSLLGGVATCVVPLFTGLHTLRAEYAGSPEALPATATVLHSAGAVPGTHCAGFDDVDGADPLCREVEWLRNRAITLGCAPFAFCPQDAVHRDTMAAFLFRTGGAVGPDVQTASLPWLVAPGTFCLSGLLPARGHPGRVVIDAVVSGIPGSAGRIHVRPVVGTLPIGPFATATAHPGRALAVRVSGSADVAAGSTDCVGLEWTADPFQTLADPRAIVRTQRFDRTGTHTPFDAPQGARP